MSQTSIEENPRFSGISRLYGTSGLSRLQAAKVAVIGIGGVGSWVAEALARSGIGSITLIDLDDICITNTNRQLHALHDTVGAQKTHVMAERIRLINPNCQVQCIEDFYTEENSEAILAHGFDYIVDAIDSLNSKVHLIHTCKIRKIPVVTVGGAGGRRDPGMIKRADLSASFGDGLLKRVRKKLRTQYNYPLEGLFNIPCVFSNEQPYFPSNDGEVCRVPKDKALNYNLDCNSGFGTASFVTGTFGFTAAAIVTAHIAGTDI